MASATTEVGVGGDLRSSLCAVEVDGDRFRLTKKAPVISYGEAADDILVTCRKSPDARPATRCTCWCAAAITPPSRCRAGTRWASAARAAPASR